MSLLNAICLIVFGMVASSFVTFMVMDMKGFMKFIAAKHKAHLAHIDSLGRVANVLNQCRASDASADETDDRIHTILVKEVLAVGKEDAEKEIG